MGEKARYAIVLLVITVVCVAALGGVYFGVKEQLERSRRQKLLEAVAAACRFGETCPTPEEAAKWEKQGTYIDEKGKERKVTYFDSPTGYAVEASGKGYGGKVKVVVGWDKELKHIVRIVVVEHKETPGLGARVKSKNSENTLFSRVKDESELRPWFERHFDGLTLEQLRIVDEPVKVVLKDGTELSGEIFWEDAETVKILSGGEKKEFKREQIRTFLPQGVKGISGATITTNAVIEAVKKSHSLLDKILKRKKQ